MEFDPSLICADATIEQDFFCYLQLDVLLAGAPHPQNVLKVNGQESDDLDDERR